MKFCIHCGAKINNNAEYCPRCGARQTKHAEEQSRSQIHNGQRYKIDPALTQPAYGSRYHNQQSGYKVRITPPPCTLGEAWSAYWHQYAKGHGYSSRAEFWKMYLINIIISIIAGMIIPPVGQLINQYFSFGFNPTTFLNIIFVAYGLACIIPSISLVCRRLRDEGTSNGAVIAWVVSLFIPVIDWVTAIIVLIKCCMPSVRYRV